VEVKCPQSPNHLRFFIDSNIKPEYLAQMQFQMACTGRKWCDFVSYNPNFVGKSTGLRMKIKRVNRDEEQIERINQAVEIFLAEIEQEMQKILTKAA
ncbi:YqaJ viral recombinase family protein, partial [Bartonella saheliensis]|uniref:YqaJ viral recombinase family protein n=1 Tax=Bartonella saheliensis TaxID=1457016 RepID=UPI001FE2F63D